MSFHRLRAPTEHGQLLAQPPLDQVGALLETNHRALAAAHLTLLGRSLVELRLRARTEALAASHKYHADAGEPLPPAAASDNWLLAGHQPELFHPGVWVKNFALRGLAAQHRAFSLNLVVDNDTPRSNLLRLPDGVFLARLPFDRWRPGEPYEERAVLDEELFASVPERARPLTARWPFAPLLPTFWAEVQRQAGRTPLLGERFAAARRNLERRWGCLQHEVPLSALCGTEAFAWFACHLLAELPRLHAAYNGAVAAYRERYGLHDRQQPVPDLASADDWLEAPFWAWRTGERRRGRLFVRRASAGLELRSDRDPWPTLTASADTPEKLVEQWLSLEPRGYKVRTRALTTTLFARLLLSDLFVHGIGGGKYDEVTDSLFTDFLGVPAPSFLVLSATLLLPLPRLPATERSCRLLGWLARDAWYNPQRHLPPGSLTAEIAGLLAERQEWVERAAPTRRDRAERAQKLRALTARLRDYLRGPLRRHRRQLATCREQLAINRVARRRDYAYCLYPEETLRPFCQGLLGG